MLVACPLFRLRMARGTGFCMGMKVWGGVDKWIWGAILMSGFWYNDSFPGVRGRKIRK